MSGARLKHYGWGREDEGMTAEKQAFVLGRYHAKFARDAFETKAVPRLEDLTLRAPRVALPTSKGPQCPSDHTIAPFADLDRTKYAGFPIQHRATRSVELQVSPTERPLPRQFKLTKRSTFMKGQGSFRSSPAVNIVPPSSAALKTPVQF